MADLHKSDYYNRRISSLKTERQTFINQYMELAEFIQPRRGRFFITDRNKGDKRWNKIINSSGTMALRTARAGMFAGTMSPSRPWFALATTNRDLMEFAPVKQWCYQVTDVLQKILASSNFYNMTPTLIGELLLFGTGCMTQVDDFDDVARFYTHTAGSYMIAQDGKYKVNTVAREFEWTTDMMVREFGKENCSLGVRNAYDKGNYDSWWPVNHIIEPNDAYNKNKLESKFKKFKSCYFEPGNVQKDQYLAEEGFDDFPAYCPRWDVAGEDIYGTDCPAMTALGDIKQLQIEEKRKAQGIDKMVNPPMSGPPTLRNVPVSSLPGGLTIYDNNGGQDGLKPLYMVNTPLAELRMDMDAVEQRIQKAFFNDLFMAITNMEGIQPQNELTINSRNEERLLQIGPVLERLHNELLGPVIDRTFNQAVKAKILPPIPKELSGQPLKVDYISSLAMAQKSVALSGMDRLVTFVGALVKNGFQDVIDKIDADQLTDQYSAIIGNPPSIVRSDDAVAALRQQRAQEAQQAQMAQMAAQIPQGINQLANSPTGTPNALTALAGAAGANGGQ